MSFKKLSTVGRQAWRNWQTAREAHFVSHVGHEDQCDYPDPFELVIPNSAQSVFAKPKLSPSADEQALIDAIFVDAVDGEPDVTKMTAFPDAVAEGATTYEQAQAITFAKIAANRGQN